MLERYASLSSLFFIVTLNVSQRIAVENANLELLQHLAFLQDLLQTVQLLLVVMNPFDFNQLHMYDRSSIGYSRNKPFLEQL